MKKTLSRIIAAVACASVLAPMSSNAVMVETNENSSAFLQEIEGYTKVENVHFFDWQTWNGEEYTGYNMIYVNNDGTKFKAFKKRNYTYILVNPAENVDIEKVENELKELTHHDYENAKIKLQTYYPEKDKGTLYVWRGGSFLPDLDTAMAVTMLDYMKEKGYITSGRITHKYYIQDFNGKGVNYYKYSDEANEIITDFVEKNLKGYSIETENIEDNNIPEYIKVVSPDNTTTSEMVKISEKIYEATNLSPVYSAPESMKNVDTGTIDVFNAVKGDANCDGKSTIADAVAILQSIGNKDKYALSAQGEFNGDIIGNYDGITANDALEIQKIDSQQQKSD